MKHFIFFIALFLIAVSAWAQPSNRVKLRQLEAAPGSGYIIQSLNDTCLWVGVSSVVKYQTLKDDGTPLTQRGSINFVATPTVATTLTDDSGNDETEVSLSVIPGGVDHGGLAGLSDDDHAQYLLLAGRSGGQTATGGTGTTDDLIFKTTSGVGATGAEMQFNVGNNGATRVMTILNNGNVGVGITNPLVKFDVQTTNQDVFRYQTTGASSLALVGINTDGRSAAFSGKANGANGVVFIRGLSGNAGDILQIQNSSGVALSKFDPDGDLGVGVNSSAALSNTLVVKGAGATSATSPLLVENSAGTDIIYADDSGQVAIGTNLPARKFHVAGEVRVTDLTTDPPTRMVGADADGDFGAIAVGSGLSLSAGTLTANAAAIDHGGLAGLSDDDHTQYLLLAGRATGQVATGGTASGDDLTLRSTTDATKGDIIIQDQGGNVILGGGATASNFRIMEASGSGTEWTQFRTQPQSASVTYILPADNGDPGEVLQTNGSGTLSWESGGIAPTFVTYTFATTTTYAIPAGAKTIDITCIGGGGGGGSGRKGATSEANTGGGGGGGGGYSRVTFVVSELSSSTLDITVGAGGAGGGSISSSSTNGSPGGDGEVTLVECSGFVLCAAGGGVGGGGGNTGASSAGTGATIGDVTGEDGGTCATTGTASGGSAANGKGAVGGGAGGGIPTGGTPFKSGARPGKHNYGQAQQTGQGASDGANGSDATVDTQQITPGSGGPGGASSILTNGGAGGDGIQGGGGGGGGAALNGVGNSGTGGAGGDGFVLLIVKY